MKPSRLVFALALVPTLAHAHPGHGAANGGIGWGLVHPFTGLDHILAMIAVGLWAVQLGKRALWLLPLSFVGAMAAGAALGMGGVSLPFVEPAILASVIVLGALVASATRLPLGASATLVAVAAFFHGQSHGMEMPANASGILTAAGFLIATTMLHTGGILAGLTLQGIAQQRIIRAAGVAICSAAVLLGLGVL
ncbi:MAG: HupE/UreJ family protein [Chthoniobacteraceae bacterium]